MSMAAAGDSSVRDGGDGPNSTVSEPTRADEVVITRPDIRMFDGEGVGSRSLGDEGGDEATDSDDEEYVMP